ncbi:hypothetical protein [Xanthomonas medicagonis]|uniref:hypothetical protein n=1 Tax=Xanthomonas medicagonis TaxID=3160841 RepID=UPI003513F3DA
MKEGDRPDIDAGRALEREYVLDEFRFEEIGTIVHGFTREVLLKDQAFAGGIAEDVAVKASEYNEAISAFLLGRIDPRLLKEIRVDAMRFFADIELDRERYTLEFISKGLFDAQSSMFGEYGAEMHFAMLFFTLGNTGEPGICSMFLDYLRAHPVMKKYERKQGGAVR